MSLQIWLPLNGDLHNQGLCNFNQIINTNPTWTDNGKIGKAMMSGSITMPASAAEQILNNQAFSFACWIYVAATAGSTTDRAMLFGTSGMSANNNRKFSIFQYPSCNDLHLSWMNDAASTTFAGGVWSGVFPTGKWTHLAVTYQNPSGKIYINGTQYATFSGISNSSSFAYDTRLFENCPNNGRYLNDYRIYNHCLSDKEVEEIAKGLILHYKLDQPANINYNLYTGSKGFTGTWVNGSAWTTDTDTYNGFIVKKKSSIWGGLAQNVTAINGDIFTISFWGKVDSGGNILSIHRSSLGNVVTGLTMLDGNFSSGTNWVNANEDGTQWKRYWATLRIDNTDITYLQWRIENSVTDKFLYVAGMTLEKGYGTKNWSLSTSEAGAANIIYDSSGYQRNGTILGAPTIDKETGRYLNSFIFDGIDDGILIENKKLAPILNYTCSISFWINSTGENGERSIYFSSYNGSPFWCIEKSAGNKFRYDWNGNPDLYSTGAIVDNTWNFICFVRESPTNAKFYLNGILDTTWTTTCNTLTNLVDIWRIARDVRTSDGTPYKGNISDFRIYATALTAQQIKELYNTSASIDNKGNIHTRELVEI